MSFWHLTVNYVNRLYRQVTKEGGREGGRGGVNLLKPGQGEGEELGRTLQREPAEKASGGVVVSEDLGEEEGGAAEEGGGGGGGGGGGEGGGRREGKGAGVFTEMGEESEEDVIHALV